MDCDVESLVQQERSGELTAEEPILYGSSPAAGSVDPVSIVKEGEAVGTFYGYVWEGIDENGKDKYTDFNGNGKIDAGDRRVIGCANPDVTLGWNTTFATNNGSSTPSSTPPSAPNA